MRSLEQPVEIKHVALHESALPVLKIDSQGKILFANKAAMTLLKEWNCMASDRLPERLTLQFPELTQMFADTVLELPVGTGIMEFAVIGFPAAGYVGIYALSEHPVKPGREPAPALLTHA